MAPVKESEALGNDLARFAAEMFAKSLDLGLFPVAESSAPSRNPNRRYPKMWDLTEWQEILGRPDVDFVDFPMCAYGLGPPDEPNAFYQHWTRLVFRKAPKMKQILARQCPGVSASHRHIPLKGSRPGASVTRCTEAGVYAKCFCTQVLGAVRMVVAPCSSEKGGGQAEATDTGAECGRLPEGCPAMERRPVSGRRDWNQADSDEALLRDHERRKKWSEENDRNCPHLCWGCYEVHIRNKHNWVGFCPWCRENDLVHELEHPFTKTECDECVQVSQEADGAESGPDENEDGKAGGAYAAKNEDTKKAAAKYIDMVESPEAMESSVGVWRAAVTLGNELLDEAGSVEEAAKALWQVREETGRNNLAGVDSESLDGIIEENTLAYMRDPNLAAWLDLLSCYWKFGYPTMIRVPCACEPGCQIISFAILRVEL